MRPLVSLIRVLGVLFVFLTIVAGPIGAAPGTGSAPPAPTPAQVDFFEKRIRPLLADHCYDCHSTKGKQSGGLRLDDFRREYPALGDVPEVETMGGLLMSLLDVVPNPGDTATFRGLKLTANATDERRVRELLVETLAREGARK